MQYLTYGCCMKFYIKISFLINNIQNITKFHLKDWKEAMIQNFERIDKYVNQNNQHLTHNKTRISTCPGYRWVGLL